MIPAVRIVVALALVAVPTGLVLGWAHGASSRLEEIEELWKEHSTVVR